MSDKLSRVLATPTGCYHAGASLAPLEKLEAFLTIVEEQRAQHLERHRQISANIIFSETDMKEIHNTWMKDGNWMNRKTAWKYHWLLRSSHKKTNQEAHQLRNRAFSAYLFRVIGNKHVLLAAIKHPVFSAAELDSVPYPAAELQSFMDAWEKEKTTDEYKLRKGISQPRTDK